MLAAAALTAGYRFGGADSGARYVEPYLGAGWFNPVADRAGDDATEITVGVAGGRWGPNLRARRGPGQVGRAR